MFASHPGIAQQTVKSIEDRLQGIDSLLNKILKDQYLTGFSVAIVSGDRTIYSKGFGYSDAKHKISVTPNTQFSIGSATKAFTAGLIGLFEKEGKLSFDAKAKSYLPNFFSFYNEEMNENITARDLMTHRSGLSRHDESWDFFNTNDDANLLKRVKYMAPAVGVREKFIYSNFNYFILGNIAKQVSGMNWADQVKSRFFDPLEMKNTTVKFADFRNSKNASLGYETDRDTISKESKSYDIEGMAPAGGIYSSAHDMANWLKMWIKGGKYNSVEILPASFVKQATSSQTVATPAYPRDFKDIFMSNYGFGWYILSFRGYYAVNHGGNYNGFSSMTSFFPTEKIGIVVLTNQRGSEARDIIYYALADKLLNVAPFDWNGRFAKLRETSREQSKLKAP